MAASSSSATTKNGIGFSEKDVGISENIVSTSMPLEFKLRQVITEEHNPPRAQVAKIWSVRFCDILPAYYSYFASVAANVARIYRLSDTPSGNTTVELVMGFPDEDVEEVLYSCAWGASEQGTPILVVGGLRGVLKCIDCVSYEVVILLGHGAAVNDLRAHTVDDGLVFSASKDESIRLWNIRTGVCVAIFAGEKGHRDEVLAIDIHPLGGCFVSAGMDTHMKIWNLEEPAVRRAIELSYTHPRREGNKAFLTITIQTPIFSTPYVHSGYLDSIRFVGNCVLSRSTSNQVCLWMPDNTRYKGAALVLRDYVARDGGIWYIRLDVCVPLNIFALGNINGTYAVTGRWLGGEVVRW
jgi:polycomb protein EED